MNVSAQPFFTLNLSIRRTVVRYHILVNTIETKQTKNIFQSSNDNLRRRAAHEVCSLLIPPPLNETGQSITTSAGLSKFLERENYFTFLFVRHPFERQDKFTLCLCTALRDKFL